jgi:tetratricopeptide (TPR) repeat protein
VNTALLRQSIAAADTLSDRKPRVQRLQELSRQVAFLRRELTTAEGETETARTGRGAVDAAHAVLAGAEYDSEPFPSPSRWDRWLDERARAFQRWLDSLHFSPHPYTGPTPSISPQFINGIVIALGIGLFALLVALLVSLLRRRTARARPPTLDETEAALVEARDMDSLHALAERKAQEGDYRLALRFIYLALLVALDTGGVLRFDRSRTNWEYLRALRASGRDDVYQAMTPLTREFDRVWYGLAHADAADYARALSQYEALQAVSQTLAAPKKVAATV